MKRLTLIILAALIILGGIAFTGCRDGTTSPGVVINWDDMPLYAGASQVDKGNWTLPPEIGDWAALEWRYYKFDDTVNSVEMVTMFYRNEMPKNGWTENVWMETAGASWGAFSKNGERDNAIIWISTEEGHTIFALMRASN